MIFNAGVFLFAASALVASGSTVTPAHIKENPNSVAIGSPVDPIPIEENSLSVGKSPKIVPVPITKDSRWIEVSRKVVFYDENTPVSIKNYLRRNIEEYDVLADEPTYPTGKSAKDFRGLVVEYDPFDLS
jgi:hypothetical protein